MKINLYVSKVEYNVLLQEVALFITINLLKPSCNFTYHQVHHSITLHSAQIAFMYSAHISEQTATFAVNISNSFAFYSRGWKCLLRCTHRVFI
jgi:hypothetical protein